MNATTTAVNEFETSAKRRKRGLFFWVSRGLLGLSVGLFALVASSALYEAVSAPGDAERFPVPGQLVTVNGRTMHLNCSGTSDGSTDITVILEAGANIWSDTWAVVQPDLGKLTRTCSYDRAGYGWSQPSVNPPTPEQGAHDLHALLGAAEIAPPYVLVGHSMGGKYIRLFASLYPDEVAGLVFVDARHESMEPQGRTPEQHLADREAYESSLGLYRTLRQLGVARLVGLQLGRALDPTLENYPDDVAYRMVLFSTYEQTLQTMMGESSHNMDSDALLSASELPENLPIIVLTAKNSLENEGWEAGQAALAALTNNSVWEIVPDSSHNIHAEQPAAVVEAVGRMLNTIQSNQPLKKAS